MSKLTKVAVLAMLVFAATAFANAQLNVTFLDSEGGASYTFDKVIISDGEDVQMFENVDQISAVVPEEFTLTAVYHVGPHHNMFEIPLNLASGETLELEIYALDPNAVQGRLRPYLAGKEVGIGVDLGWVYSEADTVLTYIVQTSPPHRPAIVATWIQTGGDFEGGHLWVAAGVEINGYVWRYGVCINGVDWIETPHFSGHTSLFIHVTLRKDLPREIVESRFSRIPDDRSSLGVRRANYNYARVITDYRLRLRDLDGQNYEPEYFYPQWDVQPGLHYILRIDSMPADFVPLEYPLFVSDATDAIILDLYPRKLAELAPDTFFAAAEDFYANSSYSNLTGTVGDSMAVDVATENATDWCGCFVLSDDYTVERLSADGAELAAETDYIINPADGYNLVTVRILPSYGQLVLDYAPAPPLGAEEAEVLPALKTHLDQSDTRAEISYSLPRSAHVELSVYSADGRKVKSLVSEAKPAGSYTVYWNTSEVPAGLYFCRLEADGIQAVEKTVHLK